MVKFDDIIRAANTINAELLQIKTAGGGCCCGGDDMHGLKEVADNCEQAAKKAANAAGLAADPKIKYKVQEVAEYAAACSKTAKKTIENIDNLEKKEAKRKNLEEDPALKKEDTKEKQKLEKKLTKLQMELNDATA